MRKLKCFMGNHDGRRRGVILATSQVAAAKALGQGVASFRNFWHDIEECPVPNAKPLTLYTRPIDDRGEFVEGICELPTKRSSW